MLRYWIVLVSLALCFLGSSFCAALALPTSVKVTLFQAHPNFTALTIDGAFELTQGGGVPLHHVEVSLAKNGLFWKSGRGAKAAHRVAALEIKPLAGKPLILRPQVGGLADGRPYRGRIFVTASGGKLNVVNEVDAKSYITSVVGSESAPEFSLEALKAQAVLATTVLARQRPGMKLSDTTDVQAYLGSDYERPLAKQAVAAVFGQTLKGASGSTPAVYYHSTCAGGTSDEREIFSGKVLNDSSRKPVSSCRTATRVKCKYCQASPFYKAHEVSYSTTELKNKVGYVPLSVDLRDPQGRPLSVSVEQVLPGNKQKVVSLSGYDLWLKLGKGLGWGAVPGMRYSFSCTDKHSSADKQTITFTSTGAGHGAGLCQWGAAGMARSGKNYKEILQYYFPLAEIKGLKTPNNLSID